MTSSIIKLPVTLINSINPKVLPDVGLNGFNYRWAARSLQMGAAVNEWGSSGGTVGAKLVLQSGTPPKVASVSGVPVVAWDGTSGNIGVTGLPADSVRTIAMVYRPKAGMGGGQPMSGGGVLISTSAFNHTLVHGNQSGSNPAIPLATAPLGRWYVIIATVPAGSPALGAKLRMNNEESTQASTSTSKISQLVFGAGTGDMDIADIITWPTALDPAERVKVYQTLKSGYPALAIG